MHLIYLAFEYQLGMEGMQLQSGPDSVSLVCLRPSHYCHLGCMKVFMPPAMLTFEACLFCSFMPKLGTEHKQWLQLCRLGHGHSSEKQRDNPHGVNSPWEKGETEGTHCVCCPVGCLLRSGSVKLCLTVCPADYSRSTSQLPLTTLYQLPTFPYLTSVLDS